MFRSLLPLVLTLGLSIPANAQELVRERPPMDSLTQAYHDALTGVRDSIAGIGGSLRAFRNDLRTTAAVTISHRAAQVRGRCVNTVTLLASLDSVFDPDDTKPGLVEEVGDLRAAITQLKSNLQALCIAVFDPAHPHGSADSLRAWGPYHAAELDRSFRGYAAAASRLARVADIMLEPRGVRRP